MMSKNCRCEGTGRIISVWTNTVVKCPLCQPKQERYFTSLDQVWPETPQEYAQSLTPEQRKAWADRLNTRIPVPVQLRPWGQS